MPKSIDELEQELYEQEVEVKESPEITLGGMR